MDEETVEEFVNDAYTDFCRDSEVGPVALVFALQAGRSTYEIRQMSTSRVEDQVVGVIGTGGSFTLEYDGQVSAAIVMPPTDVSVLAAMNALSNIQPGELTVVVTGSGSQTDPYDIALSFLAPFNRPQVIVDGSLLTGPGAAIDVETKQQGGTTGILRFLSIAVSEAGERITDLRISTDVLDFQRMKSSVVDPGVPMCALVLGLSSIEVFPVPDEDMVLTGYYVPRPARLVEAVDEPLIPEEYHRALFYRGVQLAIEWDRQGDAEAMEWERRYMQQVGLARRQRTRMTGNRPKSLRASSSMSGRSAARDWPFPWGSM